MQQLVIYTSPKDAVVHLALDSGAQYYDSYPETINGRDDGHVLNLPDGTPSQGATLTVTLLDFVAFGPVRGVLNTTTNPATFQLDDIQLSPVPVPEPLPPMPPDPGPMPPPDPNDPLSIIEWVYTTTHPDLSTLEGCGKFTEDCCQVLHNYHTSGWGHIKKFGAQTNYRGHAVDAVMLIWDSKTTRSGIYDIVFASASHDAKPQFVYKGDPALELWYYPA